MKKFRFRLETVLNLRKTREEEAHRQLAQAQRIYQQELAQKAALNTILADSLARRESLGVESIGIDAFQLENNFVIGTKQRIVQQTQAVFRASRGVEKALRAYLFAKRQSRMIEILREKQFKEFKIALAKKEQKDLDDLSVMRARLNQLDEEDTQGEQTA
jgi:flagellar FliJ protein